MEEVNKHICAICGESFDDLKDFAKHLRSDEKIKQADYAYKYINKKDLWSGEHIRFKNLQQYIETDFSSRENFRKWILKRASIEQAIEYCFNFLTKRSNSRDLNYTPSHVELRAINCLSIVGMDSYMGIKEYQNFCNKLGLKTRFDYTVDSRCDFIEDMKIFVDTREQKPLAFNCETEIKTLNVGDYSCAEPYFSDVVVERKSLEDFIGTVGKNYDRFCREIERGVEQNLYMVVVVEEKLDTAFNYKGKNSKQRFNGQSSFASVRKLMQKYENIQFLFANDRSGSAEKIKKIFSLGDKVKRMDLQYNYDIGEI